MNQTFLFTNTINVNLKCFIKNISKTFKWGKPSNEYHWITGENVLYGFSRTYYPKYPTLVKSATLCGNIYPNYGQLIINGHVVYNEGDEFGEQRCGSLGLSNASSFWVASSSGIYDAYVTINY